MSTLIEGHVDMRYRSKLEVVMEVGKWALVNDDSYPTTLSILHECQPLAGLASEKLGSGASVTCLGNWVSFMQGVCCACEMTIPADMLTLGRFAHWEQLYGYKR